MYYERREKKQLTNELRGEVRDLFCFVVAEIGPPRNSERNSILYYHSHIATQNTMRIIYMRLKHDEGELIR